MIALADLPMGSLFAGVGGLELGLEWAGIGRVVWQVEIDPWCRGVLEMHWPGVRRFDDVRRVGRRELARVGIICGGFPCQDLSVAGKGEGLEGSRSALWFEYLRIVRDLRPLVVVIENVAALATRGLDIVARGLEDEGYDVEARIISASDVGAPHRRERVFIIAILADAAGERGDERREDAYGRVRERGDGLALGSAPMADAGDDGCAQLGARHDDDGRDAFGHELDRCDPRMADAERGGLRLIEQWESARRARELRDGGQAELVDDGARGGRHAQSRLGGGAHGLPDRVDRWPARPGNAAAVWEPSRSVKRRSPVRTRRLHGLGNACVPQCLALVADRIRERLS